MLMVSSLLHWVHLELLPKIDQAVLWMNLQGPLKCSLFLGGHHLHMWLCLCVCVSVIEKTWVRGYSTKFPRRNGCRGLKFCLHIKIGVTRWKMVKMNFGVPPPPPKKNKKKLVGVQNLSSKNHLGNFEQLWFFKFWTTNFCTPPHFSSSYTYFDVQTKCQTPTTIPSWKFGRIASNPSLDNPNERTNERTNKVKYRGGRAHLKKCINFD